MKIRTGLVANSSSSSFCIIGTNDEAVIAKILEMLEGFVVPDDEEWGYETCDRIGLGYGYAESKDPILRYIGSYRIDYVGMDAERILTDRSIIEGKAFFATYMKHHWGIEVPLKAIGFHYGEAGSG